MHSRNLYSRYECFIKNSWKFVRKRKKIRKDKYFKFFIKDSQESNYSQTIINFNYNNPTKLTKDPKFKTKIIILFIKLENPFQKL